MQDLKKVKPATKKTGNWGEETACRFLMQNGFQILERNYRFGKAEIDIISKSENLLVFVEVKVRRSAQFGYPESFTSYAQKNRIKLAADHYQFENQYHGFIRFDIVSILGSQKAYEILHVEDAF